MRAVDNERDRAPVANDNNNDGAATA
jgi:hypothetical protein